MSVPNTNTFKLSDVRTELGLSAPTKLSTCFANAIDWKFNQTYKGSKDRLSNFRDYGGVKSFVNEEFFLGEIYADNTSWSTVRGATSGTVSTAQQPGIWVDYTTRYYIHRSFVTLDLSSIPAAATCLSARLEFYQTNSFGTYKDVAVLFSNHSDPLLSGDFDNFTFSDYALSDTQSTYNQCSQPNLQRKITGTSSQAAAIGNYFGGDLKLAIINKHYDNDNNTPPGKNGIEAWISGESVTGCFYSPRLYLTYR